MNSGSGTFQNAAVAIVAPVGRVITLADVIVDSDAAERCFVCGQWFRGKGVRDQHLVIHLNSVSTAVMETVDEMPCVTNGVLVPNQCPLCACVMGTRKSLRHHLLLRHVLRERGALRVLLNNKTVRRDECELVDFLVDSPEIMWKRPLKCDSILPSGSLLADLPSKLESDSAVCVDAEEDEPQPPWLRLRGLLLTECLDSSNSSSEIGENRPKCRYCRSTCFDNFLDYELHVIANHLRVALDFCESFK